MKWLTLACLAIVGLSFLVWECVSVAAVATSQANDAFDPVRAWYYSGAPLPERESELTTKMSDYYRAHSSDPDVLYWSAVAQSKGLIDTSRSLMDLTLDAAAHGQPGAMARLGASYLTGDGVPRKPQEGMALLQKAMDAGEPSAALEVGRAYALGLGDVERDPGKAETFFRKALTAGFVRAHRPLSQLLQVRGETAQALRELRAGAEAGDEDAMTAYAVVLQKGELGAARDPIEAVKWVQKAAKRGVVSAQRDIAKSILLNYAGLPTNNQNDDFGREMLQRAAAAKDPEALRILARVYLTGELGMPFDPAKAVGALNQAVELNDAAACYDLAIYHVEGLIVPRDLERARTLMRRAEALGYKSASTYLRRLNLQEPSSRPTP